MTRTRLLVTLALIALISLLVACGEKPQVVESTRQTPTASAPEQGGAGQLPADHPPIDGSSQGGMAIPPPPPGEPDDDDCPEDTPPPGPKIGWNDLPVKYHALVVQGADNKGQTAAAEAARTMAKSLSAQGYSTTSLSDESANAGDIGNWINGILHKNSGCLKR